MSDSLTVSLSDEEFLAYLKKAHMEVMSWPAWKRGLLGWQSAKQEPTPMPDSLTPLRLALADIVTAIDHAGRIARELSGDRAGRDPIDVAYPEVCPACNGTAVHDFWDDALLQWIPGTCPGCGGAGQYQSGCSDPGEPASPGDPLLTSLAARLDAYRAQLDAVIGDEVRAAIEAAGREESESE
jgi:hypothetical protein